MSVYKWLDERLDLDRLNKKFMRKAFPVHHSFFLGEITLFSFITLVLTGIFLTFGYEPSTRLVKHAGEQLPAAYVSVLYIDSLPFGRVLRSVHHWAAHIMVAAAFLHMLRILISGAYKKPREINWLLGLLLLGATVVTAFVGYSLPFDAFSVTATQIGYGIGKSIPYVGDWIAQVMFGGEYPTLHSIPRLYSLHVLWLPLLLMALIGLHMLIMIKQKHTQPKYAEEVAPGKILGVPMAPMQLSVMSLLFLLYLGVLFIIAGAIIAHPVEVYGPPTTATPALKPDWYFLWIYGILQIIPSSWKIPLPWGAEITSEFIGGVLIPGILGLAALLLPFLDNRKTKMRYVELPSHHPMRTSVTVGLLFFFFVATFAGWKQELNLSVGVLWMMLIFVPLAAWFVTYVLMRQIYGPKE